MPEEKNQVQPEAVAFEQITHARKLDSSAEGGVWEVVLVSGEWDRYNTRINPEGFVGAPSTTSIFCNHGGACTGAVLKNLRTEKDYPTGEFVNGKEVIVKEAFVGEIHVPKTAQRNYRTSDGMIKSNGSLYEAMASNQSNKVSVGFNPIEGKMIEGGKTTTYDLRNPELRREFDLKLKRGQRGEYTLWELPELSVLDVNSGQGHSITKRIRSLTNQIIQSVMPKFKKGEEFSRTSNLKIMSDAEEQEGKHFYRASIDGGEETEMEESELERLFPPAKVKSEAESKAAEAEADTKKRSQEEAEKFEALQSKIEELSSQVRSLSEAVETKTNPEPEPETKSPDPEPSAEEKDEALAREYKASDTLANLIRKNPELLNQIEDKEEKAKYERSLKSQLPEAKPNNEPAKQFGEVSAKERSLGAAIFNQKPYAI